ncbi:MAG TPA: tetratricopeptide repeat protein [Elusimicrobiota bacterium]|jgi:hypothetical protein|nr:tetratricopeptide repeat protein [Elusimicrobiota bacterium]
MRHALLPLTLSAVAVSFLSGCVEAPPHPYAPPPASAGAQAVPVSEARQKFVQVWKEYVAVARGCTLEGYGGVANLAWRNDGFRLVGGRAHPFKVWVPADNFRDFMVGGCEISFDSDRRIRLWTQRVCAGADVQERMAAALAGWSAAIQAAQAAHGAFDAAVQTYRAAAVKPELPEEARAFKIQAEAAVREKRFGDAGDLYYEGLLIAPWWPEGRYNRALLLAEIQDYVAAAQEMKRYLALVPDAPNAREAQDKVYEWDGKAKAALVEQPAVEKSTGIGIKRAKKARNSMSGAF